MASKARGKRRPNRRDPTGINATQVEEVRFLQSLHTNVLNNYLKTDFFQLKSPNFIMKFYSLILRL